jgi:tetratricopeptide (TPR) repeat protein
MKAIVFSFLFFGYSLFPQINDERIFRGIDYVYQIRFDEADSVFKQMTVENPEDPTGYFFLAMSTWWKIYINKDDRSNDDEYLSRVDRCIKLCEKILDRDPNNAWVTFLLGGVIGYRGFMNVMRDNWLKAIDDGKQGLNLIQKSYELDPSNRDAVFGIGLYNYAVDYVTERYPFLKAVLFFFPKGNKELGLQLLLDCARNGKFSKTEANAVLAYINISYEKNYAEAEKYSRLLHEMYPSNPVFKKFLGRSYIGLSKWEDARKLYREILSESDSLKYGYDNDYIRREACYYLAMSLSRLGNIDSSISLYENVYSICQKLDKEEPSAYQVFSLLAMAMLYDQKGDRNTAIRYYDMVINMKDIDNSRETARRFREQGVR